MKSVYDVIMKVRATSSKNEKIAILTANAHNNALREFLRLCYEPRVNFYISKVPAPKAEVAEGPWEFNRELMECIGDPKIFSACGFHGSKCIIETMQLW